MKIRAGIITMCFGLLILTSCASTWPLRNLRGGGQQEKEISMLKKQLHDTKAALQDREAELQQKKAAIQNSVQDATRWERRTRIYKEMKKLLGSEGKE